MLYDQILLLCRCGDLSLKYGYAQRNHHEDMKAEDGRQVSRKLNTTTLIIIAFISSSMIF